MPAGRTVALALTAAVLAAPAAAFAQGSSGAGDDQYSDPLAGGNDSGQATGGSQTGGNDLSQTPDLGGSTSGSQTTTPTTSTPTSSSADQLPNTGSDPREVILAGLALLLAGLGLRLRMADEVF